MQLIIKHKIDTPLVLPLGYHHTIQSILFHAVESVPEYGTFLHDVGYRKDKRKYKLFTFGPLQGPYSIRDGHIVFTKEVSFEVRSMERCLLDLIKENLETYGIRYCGQHYSRVQVELRTYEVEAEEIIISMCSPICLYSTSADGKTHFYRPDDEGYAQRLQDNFRRKYTAYVGKEPAGSISLQVVSLQPQDKCVTKYKGFYITGWKGTYILKGNPKYLDFLYQTGLGSKNSQGFGMFRIQKVGLPQQTL